MPADQSEPDATPGHEAHRHSPLHEVGRDPDPRFTFANERTFLAWNRTALALIGGGLAVVQFVHRTSTGVRTAVGLALIALGLTTAATSYRRWERNERAMRLGHPLPSSRLPLLLALGIAVIALIIAVLVILISEQ